MRVPDVGSSSERMLYVFGHYHLSRLRADPETADLAEVWGRAQDGLEEKMEAARVAGVVSMTALAVRDTKDDELDDAVRGFFFTLVRKVVNNRNDPLYLRYCPDGLTAIIGLPPEEEIRTVGILLKKLGDETDPELIAHKDPIRGAITSLSDAIDDYVKAVDTERLLRSHVSDEKLKWVDAYRLSYRKLQVRFHRDQKKAERYFRSARRGQKVDEDESVTADLDERESEGEPTLEEQTVQVTETEG